MIPAWLVSAYHLAILLGLLQAVARGRFGRGELGLNSEYTIILYGVVEKRVNTSLSLLICEMGLARASY